MFTSQIQVKTIFKFLSKCSEEIKGALDLSFADESVAEEKIPFLARLASSLETIPCIPYELPIGSTVFRSLITGFLRSYHNIPISQNVKFLTSSIYLSFVYYLSVVLS
jgi:methionine S-methyltransferase